MSGDRGIVVAAIIVVAASGTAIIQYFKEFKLKAR